jgi:putative ABC transport system permease protein
MYAIKTLLDQRSRFVLTVLGIAFCAVLILFLLGIYRGVAVGSVEYVRANTADLWVLQRHATNILRSTSILRTGIGLSMEDMPEVERAAPVLFILASVDLPQGPRTVYLTGFDYEDGAGGPPAIYMGRNIRADREIVLDRSFAAKHKVKIGDSLRIKKDTLVVVGLSEGTNMFVVQYSFISLSQAYRTVGFAGIASCFLVRLTPGADPAGVAADIESTIKDVAVYEREVFLQNNIREMESGILPLLSMVAVLGAVLLAAILSLILSIHVLERRKDFAVMKALGAPYGFVPSLVVLQALALALSGLAVALAGFFPLIRLVEKLSPEVSIMTSGTQVLAVVAGVLFISLLSSIFPSLKLRKIYPMEVFQ